MTKLCIFNKCIQEFESTDADYMDLAGGCGLLPDIEHDDFYSQQVIPPRQEQMLVTWYRKDWPNT